MDADEARAIIDANRRHRIEQQREKGRKGGLAHSREHMRNIGIKGNAAFLEMMTDQDFRDRWVERTLQGLERRRTA